MNDQGQVRDNHDSIWCRDGGNGEKRTDSGCVDILEVNLIGLPDSWDVGSKDQREIRNYCWIFGLNDYVNDCTRVVD